MSSQDFVAKGVPYARDGRLRWIPYPGERHDQKHDQLHAGSLSRGRQMVLRRTQRRGVREVSFMPTIIILVRG